MHCPLHKHGHCLAGTLSMSALGTKTAPCCSLVSRAPLAVVLAADCAPGYEQQLVGTLPLTRASSQGHLVVQQRSCARAGLCVCGIYKHGCCLCVAVQRAIFVSLRDIEGCQSVVQVYNSSTGSPRVRGLTPSGSSAESAIVDASAEHVMQRMSDYGSCWMLLLSLLERN